MQHYRRNRYEIFHFDRIDSTNNYAEILRKENTGQNYIVIRTEHQTHGRGQAGNSWVSDKKANLMFSLLYYPKSLAASKQFLLTQVISVAIVKTLSQYIPAPKIKWPNDVYADHLKLGGILIENVLEGMHISSVVIGTGLNINQIEFPGSLPNPGSLKSLTGKSFATDEIFHQLLDQIDYYINLLEKGAEKQLHTAYIQHLYQYNSWNTYESNGRIFKGKITGINEYGQLQITTEEHEVLTFSFKEVTFH